MRRAMSSPSIEFTRRDSTARDTTSHLPLRWLVQRGIVVIPKSARRAHLEEHFAIFDFKLTDAELDAITSLGRGQRLVNPGWAPTSPPVLTFAGAVCYRHPY